MEADGQVRADDGYRVRQSRLRTPRGGIRDSRFSRGTSVRIEFGSLRGAAGSLTNRGRRPGRLQRQSVHWPRHVRQVLRWARSCLPRDALPATICRMWNSDRSRRPEPFGGSRAGACSLDLTVPGFRVGHERVQKVSGHRGHLRDGAIDCGLIGPGRLAESRDLPHELEGGISDLLVGCGRVEVEQRFDVPAHVLWPRVTGKQDGNILLLFRTRPGCEVGKWPVAFRDLATTPPGGPLSL